MTFHAQCATGGCNLNIHTVPFFGRHPLLHKWTAILIRFCCVSHRQWLHSVDSAQSPAVNYVAQSAFGSQHYPTVCVDTLHRLLLLMLELELQLVCTFASDRPVRLYWYCVLLSIAYRFAACQCCRCHISLVALCLHQKENCLPLSLHSLLFLLLTWITWKFDYQTLHKSAVNTGTAAASALVSLLHYLIWIEFFLAQHDNFLYYLPTLSLRSLSFFIFFFPTCKNVVKVVVANLGKFNCHKNSLVCTHTSQFNACWQFN